MNDFITTKFKNSQKPFAIPEVRIVMTMLKECVLVSEDTPRTSGCLFYFLSLVAFTWVCSFYGMLFTYIFWSNALSVLYAILQ